MNTIGKTKKKTSKKDLASKAAHDKWLKDQGLHPDQIALKKAVVGKRKIDIPDYKVDKKVKTSDTIGNGFKKGVMENLHKESPEVQREILAKASRCVPQYNKGGYQYTTPETDMTQIGSKTRRG